MKRILSFLAVLICTMSLNAQQHLPALELGAPAPEFTAADTLGVSHSLADFSDRIVVVDFWASWCGDCRREMPALKQLYADWHDRGVEFLSVSFDEDANAWRSYLRKQAMPWLHISNLLPWHSKVDGVSVTTNPIAAAYDLKWIPTLILVDRGTLVAVDTTVEAFETKLREHLLGERVE